MVRIRKAIQRSIVLLVCLLSAVTAAATVTARVDRPTVDVNESFTLEITLDSNTDLEPDLSILEEDFFVGQVSRLSNTSIINGDIQRSLTWTVALMPKKTGEQFIPAVVIGTEQSSPIRIIVNEPTNAPPGEADVFVTSEVDLEETYVQSQILYRIRIYRAVATRQPALREPTITGVETLAELAGDERQYESVLNGRAYNVIERVIALYPQESGEIRISPARFEARVLRDGRITGRKVFESQEHTINVLPIPAPPANYPNAAWLPARDVQLSEEWSRPPEEMEAGEPVTRNVTLSALGQIETQLPAMELPDVDGLNVYTDQPELGRTLEAGGIRGIRSEQYAIIGLAGGDVALPALEIPWWDIAASEWKVARLPARTLTIRGAPVAAVVEPDEVDLSATESAAEPAQQNADEAIAAIGTWQRATEVLAILWLLTLAAWWWSSRSARRQRRAPREPEQSPAHKQQGQLMKTARTAAAASDVAGVRHALLEWARLQWPDDPPRSIGELARHVAPPLSDELQSLSAASYGRNAGAWDGTALANALRRVTVVATSDEVSANDPLPPLLPPTV
ncbi:MAG: BatD family protein [Gammaproteobacteria bacterium]|nr:BatD family protein [Gammaproteobacteria bacterium]